MIITTNITAGKFRVVGYSDGNVEVYEMGSGMNSPHTSTFEIALAFAKEFANQPNSHRNSPAPASTCRDCEGEGGRSIDSSGMVHPGECGGCGASYPQSLCDRDNADSATPAVTAADEAHNYHEALRRIWVAVDEAKRFDCIDPQCEKNILEIIKGVGITDPRFGLQGGEHA